MHVNISNPKTDLHESNNEEAYREGFYFGQKRGNYMKFNEPQNFLPLPESYDSFDVGWHDAYNTALFHQMTQYTGFEHKDPPYEAEHNADNERSLKPLTQSKQ